MTDSRGNEVNEEDEERERQPNRCAAANPASFHLLWDSVPDPRARMRTRLFSTFFWLTTATSAQVAPQLDRRAFYLCS